MNFDSNSVASSSTDSGSSRMPSKKDRGSIASVACTACRGRKQKCDEGKPCGFCEKKGTECVYDDPLPTKKDKSLVELLELVNNINDNTSLLPQLVAQLQHMRISVPPSSHSEESSDDASSTSTLRTQGLPTSIPLQQKPYRYVSAVTKMMAWPAVRQMLEDAQPKIPNLQSAFQEPDFPSELFHLQGRDQRLSLGGLETASIHERMSLGIAIDGSTLQLAGLSYALLEDRATTYFDTFNRIHPVLDRRYFMEKTLQDVFRSQFEENAASTLVCLVLALAEVALVGGSGGVFPAFGDHDVSEPVRPTKELEFRPPGLVFFNEARRRLGFSMTECALENIQMYILAGLYYECCSRHVEFWRMTISASLACRALITSNSAELRSVRGDQIRRAFWYCSIMETGLHLELELPLTGLEKLEGSMQLPTFSAFSAYAQTSDATLRQNIQNDSRSNCGEIFLHQISLRNLAFKIHSSLRRILGGSISIPMSGLPDLADSLRHLVDDLESQLDQWHSSLPNVLQWDRRQQLDAYQASFQVLEPQVPDQHFYAQPTLYTADAAMEGLQSTPMLGYLHDTIYTNSNDVLDALLRSRYYHLEYMLFRPFVYKALHTRVEDLTEIDCTSTQRFLQACLLWPIILPPAAQHKRMIPCLYFWSQNILGVLIFLHLSVTHDTLFHIRQSRCDPGFEAAANMTIQHGICWLRGLKDEDSSTRWCWTIVQSLYPEQVMMQQ
ncbi:hypothetical protein CORC01_12875 [Colletotrichum orchidophilum]|uniref:Zn(2)-C6 fungal-type domain-containing protein n=1 Tax=Colletotrichum orchidophilum TaxID=1209926 RepID=A0A1G4ARR8_9PEZI|nr:uncharacterized protein CORC01_12875 [Colletotrichum orchidophilum]OHE91801.1 hypothetical protein CORC01_12875 [Colletotrichum orchidophilum]